MASAAVLTRRSGRMSASFTIRREQTTGIGLDRAGGVHRSHTAAVLPSETPDHPLGDTNQVSVLLADSINRLRRGQLDPRVANAMGYSASVLLKALDQRLEERLAHLEAVISSKGETESEAFEFR